MMNTLKIRTKLYIYVIVASGSVLLVGTRGAFVHDEANLWIGCSFFVLNVFLGIYSSQGFIEKLSSVTTQMTKNTDDVGVVASELTGAGGKVRDSMAKLSLSVTETTSSAQELAAMVSRNAENSEHSRERAEVSQKAAQNGKSAVAEMRMAIRDINESNSQIMKAVEESNRSFTEISKVIADIGVKTRVINDIVFQTKLLSFNASVEAARAGEHGKGFSVVAQEVGNLARMSGKAAHEISSMLESSIVKVADIVDHTKKRVEVLILAGQEKVARGEQTAEACETALNQIVDEVGQVSVMIADISSASKDQALGIQEITKTLGEMDLITQQTQAATNTTVSAGDLLNVHTAAMGGVIEELKAVLNGKSMLSAATDSLQIKVESKIVPAAIELTVPTEIAVRKEENPLDLF